MKLELLTDQALTSAGVQATYKAGQVFEVISARAITPNSYLLNGHLTKNPTFTLYDCGTVKFCLPDWEKGVSFKTDE